MSDEPRIERVETRVYDVPTDAPEADGTFAWSSTTVVLVLVHAQDSTIGMGWTYATRACKTLVDDILADVIVGRSPLDVSAAWEAMVRRCRNVGRPGIVSMSIAAVDIALWDLKARLLGLPLCRLLGQVHAQVPVYGSGGFTTYDDDAQRRQLERWVHELGINHVKIKIGESWGGDVARDLERTRLARETVGEATELFVDANGGYTIGVAVRVGQSLGDLGVTWFEEPVSSDDLDGLAAVRRHVLPDVAAGEYGYDLRYFRRMAAHGAVDCLQVDATRCAGVTEWMRAAAVAAAHGLEVSAHTAPQMHAHAAAAVPNLRHVEYFHDHERLERIFFDGVLTPAGGMLHPRQDEPGLGVQLREAGAERFRIS